MPRAFFITKAYSLGEKTLSKPYKPSTWAKGLTKIPAPSSLPGSHKGGGGWGGWGGGEGKPANICEGHGPTKR